MSALRRGKAVAHGGSDLIPFGIANFAGVDAEQESLEDIAEPLSGTSAERA
jgi:hypothetical protein